MTLAKRSSKEFWKYYREQDGFELDGTDLLNIKKWLDSGEESITLKEMEIINNWFCKKIIGIKTFRDFKEKYKPFIIGNPKDTWMPDYLELLSSFEGKKLIEKILKEGEKTK